MKTSAKCFGLAQRGPNTGMQAACSQFLCTPRTLSVCRIIHKVINTLY